MPHLSSTPHCCRRAGRAISELHVADGKITALETGTQMHAEDERGAVALPGLSNLHSHGFQRGMAGSPSARAGRG